MQIEVNNLTKHFGTTKVLDNLSFNIDKGEVIGFLGPNGAGKTTTMRILTGFLAPTSGNIKIANLDVAEDTLAIRQKIGYLPENNPVYSLENVVTQSGKLEEHLRSIESLEENLEKAGVDISQLGLFMAYNRITTDRKYMANFASNEEALIDLKQMKETLGSLAAYMRPGHRRSWPMQARQDPNTPRPQ